MNLDTEVIMSTYDLADMINQSEEVIEYLKNKKELEENPEVIKLKKQLSDARDFYEEAQRFGHFHPNFHEAKEKVDKVLAEINKNEIVKKYKKSEDNLNELLFLVSNTLASTVSPSIKVPRADNLMDDPFCTTGSCNTCGIKGSCAI